MNMLSEQAKLLLSAYVDGGLPRQQAAAAEKLLRESVAARNLVKHLRDNIVKLKSLPRHSLGAAFPAQVLAQLPATSTLPAFEPDDAVVRAPRLRRGLPTWAVGGIAVSLLAGLVFGGVYLAQGQREYDQGLLPSGPSPIARINPDAVKSPVRNEAVEQLIFQAVVGSGQAFGETKPKLPAVSPQNDAVQFAFSDLQKRDSFDAFKWQLARADLRGVHLDVTVKYNRRSLERVIESLSKQGVQLVITPPAEASVAKKQPVLIYAENVPADKLALALQELGQIDVAGQKKEPSTFTAVRIAPDSADDYKRFSQRLGVEPHHLKSPAAPVPHVSSMGVVLPAEGTPSISSETRSFLASRGPVQIGTLQVFLHLLPTEK